MCEKLWNLVKEAMWALMMLDTYDDDQQLLLMAVKREPSIFLIQESDWFLPIRYLGGEHLDIGDEKKQRCLPRKSFKGILIKAYLACRKIVRREKTQNREFAERMLSAARNEYSQNG